MNLLINKRYPDVGNMALIPMFQMKDGQIAVITGNVTYSQYNNLIVKRVKDDIICNLFPDSMLTWSKYSPLKVLIIK